MTSEDATEGEIALLLDIVKLFEKHRHEPSYAYHLIYFGAQSAYFKNRHLVNTASNDIIREAIEDAYVVFARAHQNQG